MIERTFQSTFQGWFHVLQGEDFSSIHRAISLFTPLSSMSEYRSQLQSFVFNMKIVGVLIFFTASYSFNIYRWTKEKEIIEKETGFPREGEEQRQR